MQPLCAECRRDAQGTVYCAEHAPVRTGEAPVGTGLAPTPHIELAALEDAVDRLKAAATAYDSAYADKGGKLDGAARTRLNAQLRDID